MKYAVIYARYSSERQNDQSIEGQLRICNKYAEDNGLTIVDTYIDRAMMGTNDQRAAFQKIVLFDDKTEIYFNYVKNYYPDDFSPEIARDSSFIECSIDFQFGAPKNPIAFMRLGFLISFNLWLITAFFKDNFT